MIAYKTINEYLKNYPPEVQARLNKMRETIQKAAPDATEAISYGIPTFKLNGNLVHFAAYKNHIGFYPGAEAIGVFVKELKGYPMSKGTVQFPLDAPIPYDLITKITLFRVKQNLQKK